MRCMEKRNEKNIFFCFSWKMTSNVTIPTHLFTVGDITKKFQLFFFQVTSITFSMSWQIYINPFLLNVPFWPPGNMRKPRVFWCFQGDQKRTLGRKGLKKSRPRFSLTRKPFGSLEINGGNNFIPETLIASVLQVRNHLLISVKT